MWRREARESRCGKVCVVVIRDVRINWPTHLRTVLVLLGALALFGGAATQLIGHLLRYDPRLGGGLFEFAGVRFYAPWAALGWAAQWTLQAPWFALLVLILIASCALAAYAVANLFAELQPIALFPPPPWRNLANWRELGDCGLLRDEGLLLGAVYRHALAKHDLIRIPRGHCLFLGDPALTDDVLIAALSGWRGPLVMIDARGLSNRLHRQNVLRFAPGRTDIAAINPLLSIRGRHSWSDARLFAQAFLRLDEGQSGLADVLALLMLDQLLTAPLEARNLAAVRRRLIDKQTTLAELCGRWALNDFPTSFPPEAWEMARVARLLREHIDYGLQALVYIDDALSLVAGAGFAQATSAHHLRFADFVAGGDRQTLVVSLDAADAEAAAPLILGLLAQLASACAGASGAKQRLLVVIDAEAVRALTPETKREGGPKPAPPLRACEDFDLLIQAGDIGHATGLMHRVGLHRDAPFDAVVSVGAQSEANAKAVSELGRDFEVHRQKPAYIPRWRRLIFPPWERASLPRLPVDALRAAASGEAFLLLRDMRPVRIAALTGGASRASFISPNQLAPAPHDWTSPPLIWPATATPVEGDQAEVSAHSVATGAKLRRALTRSVTPKAKTKSKSTGCKTR